MRAALLAIALGLGGCAGGPAAVEPPAREPPPRPLQIANGPLEAPRAPLAVDLEGALGPSARRVRPRFGRPPAAGLLFDLDTGAVLWSRRPLAVLPMASLTKMLTALVAAEALGPRAPVRVSRAANAVRGSRVGLFRTGQAVRADTLLHGALLASGNDAAVALAEGAAGSVPAFVARVNARARAMGLSCTALRTPHGLSAGDRSCAADLAAVARAVLDSPRLARIVRRRRAALPFATRGGRLHLSNTNPLLRTGYGGTIGIKTGYTRRAGRCLVAAVSRGGRRLGLVLLGSPDTGRQARHLLDRAQRSARSD